MSGKSPALPVRPPEPEADTFWEWCAKGELRIQCCANCGRWVYFPAPRCYRCLSDRLEWTPVSGRGTVYTFTVIHRAVSATFRKKIPYVVAWVELPEQEGLRILAEIEDCAPEDVRIGMEVTLGFAVDELGQKVPFFRPAGS